VLVPGVVDGVADGVVRKVGRGDDVAMARQMRAQLRLVTAIAPRAVAVEE
jgi:hypothetical protein